MVQAKYFLLSILKIMLRDFLTSPSTPGMADQNFDMTPQPLEKLTSITISDPGGGRISDFSALPTAPDLLFGWASVTCELRDLFYLKLLSQIRNPSSSRMSNQNFG